MKRLIALFLVLVICLSLCACGGKLEGTYQDNLGFSTITFEGDTIEYISLASDGVKTGTYVIEDDKIIVNYDNGQSDTFEYDEETGTFSFCGILIYRKVEK